MFDWFEKRRLRREKLAQLECAETVSLDTAIKLLTKETERQRRVNDRILLPSDVPPDPDEGSDQDQDDPVVILEDPCDQSRSQSVRPDE